MQDRRATEIPDHAVVPQAAMAPPGLHDLRELRLVSSAC
jgi:hypothetical protein